jgi:hypothetical protein
MWCQQGHNPLSGKDRGPGRTPTEM